MAGSTVTNTGPTVINGNVGVSPGTAITGFPPGIVNAPYTFYQNDAVAAQAQSDLTTAYNLLAGRPFTVDLTGQDLGNRTLTAGVYNFNSSAQLTGPLILDGGGNPNAVFVFNIGSDLTTASNSSIVLANGAQAGNVFFRVGSSATLGTDTLFLGQILALTSITLNTGADILCGAALARNGAVTLDTNTITICTIPPGTVIAAIDAVGASGAGALADALAAFVAAGGVLPLGFQVLALLTPEELAIALAQLIGEAGTGVAPAGMQSMDSFMGVVLNDRSFPVAPEPEPGTISALGYWPQSGPAGGSAFLGIDQADGTAMPDIGRWNIWGATYGGYKFTSGNAAAGTHDRITRDFGIAAGFDYRLSEDTKVGFAVSVGGTNFGLSDGFGGGHGDAFQAAVYGRRDFNPGYVEGGLAYGLHNMTTDRYVTIAGTDHFSANFLAHALAGQVEAGYEMGLFTPYAALRGQAFFTPAYSERTVSGNSTFALNYDAHTALSARTELGVRFAWSDTLDDNTILSLSSSVAWAHDFATDNVKTASFQAIPGLRFNVAGAEPARDSLLLSAGAELRFDNGYAVAAGLNGALSSNSQNYGGALRVSYSW